ncbi:hypothetical protein [Psychrobacter sp. I-STPA6b]|uniref:hypothetical protein n=1 Tax=Psychrobacter sp. I-STPA6b TaxID=2585718 RepID=UPI001D0C2082|nr:hypothetical protein [Psychrobacter sp. I-STPA6b]
MNTLMVIMTSLFFFVSPTQTGTRYECARYVDNRPTGGYVKVYAESKEEAEQKALKKYDEMGYRVDYVICK